MDPAARADPEPEVVILPDLPALSEEAARRVALRCRAAQAERGECAIALSGGETPRTLYARLAAEPYRGEIRWDRLRMFWGDERGVPPDDPRSNYGMAQEALLRHVPIPPQQVHRMPADRRDLDAAADEYAALLRAHLPQSADGWPRFDLILLGLGDDGHTASLFPGAPALHETQKAVVAYRVPHLGADRMTVTPPVLNHAAGVLFLVSGAGKAHALSAVLEGPYQPGAAPAQIVRPLNGALVWLVDAAAASRLSRRSARGAPRPEGFPRS